MSKMVQTILITREHVFAATVVAKGRRLLDLLNDSLTGYVQAQEAQVFRGLDMQQPIASFPTAQVHKSALSMVILIQDEHEAPLSRFYGYVQKIPHRVFVAVPGYEVEGQLHLPPATKPTAVVLQDLEPFFPVTQAKLTRTSPPFETMEVPVVMIQRPMVELFCLDDSA